jgi:hypothetical protein
MSKANTLSLSRVQTLFNAEVQNLGGTMRDTFADGTRLFARAVLPLYRDVRRNDTMQCGIALRAREDVICVHPYLFRLVCANGAITAHAVQSRRIENFGALPVAEAETTLLAALRECGSKEAFVGGMDAVRSALDIEADAVLTLMPFLSQMPAAAQGRLLMDMLDNLHAERDMSGFGLMNAITATARDTDDPDLRWNLEEFGGGIPALLLSQPALRRGAAASLAGARQALHEETCPEWREAGRSPERMDECWLTSVA